MDYQGNSKKSKEDKPTPEGTPVKNVEKVVVGEIVIKKKGLGRKFKDLFVEADFGSAARYVVSDVLLPAARNMIVDATTKGIERMVYGDRAMRQRNHGPGVSRIRYDSSPIRRSAPAIEQGPRRSSRHGMEDYILQNREDADMVLERMRDIIDKYEVASMADLNELLGLPINHVDNRWGWIYLGDAAIRQVRDGFLLDIPPAEAIPGIR